MTVATVFPNLSLITVYSSPDPKGRTPCNFRGVRQWQPRGPGRIELWSWIFSWKEAPEEYDRRTYVHHMATFGSSGIFEQDDTEPWSTITRIAGSTYVRTQRHQLNYQMGLNGIGTAKPFPEFPGPGTAFTNRYEEGVMRALVADWVRYMRR